MTLVYVLSKVKKITEYFYNMGMLEESTLFKAISNYGKYTKNQAKVLCFLVDNAVDNLIFPAPKKISEETGVVKSTVYAALNVLQLDEIIKKDSNNKGLLKINRDKINFILKAYKN